MLGLRGLLGLLGLGYLSPDVLAGHPAGAALLTGYLILAVAAVVGAHSRGTAAHWPLYACDVLLLAAVPALTVPGPGALFGVAGGLALLLTGHSIYAAPALVACYGLAGVGITSRLAASYPAGASTEAAAGFVLAATLLSVWLAVQHHRQFRVNGEAFITRTRATMTAAIAHARTRHLESGLRLHRTFVDRVTRDVLRPLARAEVSTTMVSFLRDQHHPLRLVLGVRPGRDHIRDYLTLGALLAVEPGTPHFGNVRLSDLMARICTHAGLHTCTVAGLDRLAVATDPLLLALALRALLHRTARATATGQGITMCGTAGVHQVTLSIYDRIFVEAAGLDQPPPPLPGGRDPVETDLEILFARHCLHSLDGDLFVDHHPERGTAVSCVLPGPQENTPWLSRIQLNARLKPLS